MAIIVERITNLTDLEPFRESWNVLARLTPMAQFFQSYDWFAAYWKHCGQNQQMEVLLVFDDFELVGIVPLVIRRERRRVGTIRVLTFPLDDWGSFYGPVGRCPEQTVKAAIETIARGSKNWDILSWRWLDPESPASAAIAQQMARNHLRTIASTRSTTALISLPASWEEYMASRTSKFRNNVRRWQRRNEELGTLRYEKYRPSFHPEGVCDPRWDLYDQCEQLAARSWQGSSEDGTTLSHETVRPFLRAAHLAAAELGALDLNLLYLNEDPIAFEYGYSWQGYKFSLRFGYDSERGRDGLGNLMWLETIKGCLEAGDHTFDMGPGSMHFKCWYLTQVRNCNTLDYFRPLAPRAQAIALKHRLTSWWGTPSTAT